MRSSADLGATLSAYGGFILEQTSKTTPAADALIGQLPEPVRRYLRHELPAGLSLTATSGVRLQMTGKTSSDCGSRSPRSRIATVARLSGEPALGSVQSLRSRLSIATSTALGGVTGRLLGRYELFHQADEHVRRSAAGRTALEAIMAPASLLPGRGVSWRAENDEHTVASSYLEPEQTEVHVQIDSREALRAFSAKRRGDTGTHSHRYLTFGGDMHADRRFGDLGSVHE